MVTEPRLRLSFAPAEVTSAVRFVTAFDFALTDSTTYANT